MAMMKEEIRNRLSEIAEKLGIGGAEIRLDFPENIEHGDYSTNMALSHAKKVGLSQRALGEKITEELRAKMPDCVQSVEIAGPGFLNFRLKDELVGRHILDEQFERAAPKKKTKVLIEYTDPNTFKVFHIGHLMSNAIGEALSRLIESAGSKVVRICYPSDIGLHIAKSIWAIRKNQSQMPADGASLSDKTAFLGRMYVAGTKAYEEDARAKTEIDELNKIIYERSDPSVSELFDKGRKWSLEHFDKLYELLGTRFDEQIAESDMAPIGLDMVRDNANKGIFEESQGAIVFKGEKYGLHTRVFINSHGLPTYEAKDVGLHATKFRLYPDADTSIIVTANEQNDYFKVLLKVFAMIDDKNGNKSVHVGHGMLRFASGKMSSRKGNVISAEALIGEIKEMVSRKIADRRFDPAEADRIADTIAVGAIKYTILRSSIGSDIIFDSAASISFEGDSGPYLQYSAVRAASVEKKAAEAGLVAKVEKYPQKVGSLEKMMFRFEDVLERASLEMSPQIVAGYLMTLAGVFNHYYATQPIIDPADPLSPYRVALVGKFRSIMTRGLDLLGIGVPERM